MADARARSGYAEPLLLPRDLSDRWGVTVGHLANLRSAGKGPTFIRLSGGAVRYRLSDVLAHENARMVEPIAADDLHAVRAG